MGRFAGKVAIVTGAGSGIGRATAARLASEGAAVACLDIAEGPAQDTVDQISGAGGTALAIATNVADPHQVATSVSRAVDALGPPNVLCNIAGIGTFSHSTELAFDEWQRIIAVNLTGTFLMAQSALPHLLDNNGVIVNTASTAGIQAQPYSAAYCASKGGVIMLTRALAYEYIDRGVRINAVAPGGVDTPIVNSFALPDGANWKLIEKMMTPRGMATADEIAALFAYIASDEARYMTGSIVTMDGGITL